MLLPFLVALAVAAPDDPLATEGSPGRQAAAGIERRETLVFELAAGVLATRNDAYTQRIDDFGFDTGDVAPLVGVWTAAAAWSPTRHLALLATTGGLDHRTTSRDLAIGSEPARVDEFRWGSHLVALGPRGQLPMLDAHVIAAAEVGVGLAWSASRYASVAGTTRQTQGGPALTAAVSVAEMPVRPFGFFQQVRWTTAPALRDLIGDVHDNGGFSISIGLRAGY